MVLKRRSRNMKVVLGMILWISCTVWNAHATDKYKKNPTIDGTKEPLIETKNKSVLYNEDGFLGDPKDDLLEAEEKKLDDLQCTPTSAFDKHNTTQIFEKKILHQVSIGCDLKAHSEVRCAQQCSPCNEIIFMTSGEKIKFDCIGYLFDINAKICTLYRKTSNPISNPREEIPDHEHLAMCANKKMIPSNKSLDRAVAMKNILNLISLFQKIPFTSLFIAFIDLKLGEGEYDNDEMREHNYLYMFGTAFVQWMGIGLNLYFLKKIAPKSIHYSFWDFRGWLDQRTFSFSAIGVSLFFDIIFNRFLSEKNQTSLVVTSFVIAVVVTMRVLYVTPLIRKFAGQFFSNSKKSADYKVGKEEEEANEDDK